MSNEETCRSCGGDVPAPGHVMCAEHWAQVPKDIQKEIFKQRTRQTMGRPDAGDRLNDAVTAAAAAVARDTA